MRFGAAFWINRTDWPSLRDACLAVERAGWDSLWVDDHLLADEGDPTDAKLEGWATLSALAVLTERVRLGLLVGANTFRNPGLTAKLATTVDHLSDGRLVLGLGGGWFEREHDAFGIDFGSGFGERLDRLDEAVGLIRRLLDGERVTHEGRFYRMHDAICEPRPVQARLPILIGGSGPTKTLRTTARDADLWNAYGSPERIAATSEILRERCAEIGRPFEAIERTVTIHAVVRDDRRDARRPPGTRSRGSTASRTARAPTAATAACRSAAARGEVAAYVDGYRRIGVARGHRRVPLARSTSRPSSGSARCEPRSALTVSRRHGAASRRIPSVGAHSHDGMYVRGVGELGGLLVDLERPEERRIDRRRLAGLAQAVPIRPEEALARARRPSRRGRGPAARAGRRSAPRPDARHSPATWSSERSIDGDVAQRGVGGRAAPRSDRSGSPSKSTTR